MFNFNKKQLAAMTLERNIAQSEAQYERTTAKLWEQTAHSIDNIRKQESVTYQRTIAELAQENAMLEAESLALVDALQDAHEEIDELTELADALVSFAIGGAVFVLVDGNAPAGAKTLEQAMDDAVDAAPEPATPNTEALVRAFEAGASWRFDRALFAGVSFGQDGCLTSGQIESRARTEIQSAVNTLTIERAFNWGAHWRFSRALRDGVRFEHGQFITETEYQRAAAEYAAKQEGR